MNLHGGCTNITQRLSSQLTREKYYCDTNEIRCTFTASDEICNNSIILFCNNNNTNKNNYKTLVTTVLIV